MPPVTVATLRAVVTLEDRQLQQGLAKTRQGFKDTAREADKASRDFNKAEKEASSLGKTLSRVGGIIGAGAVLEGVRRFAGESVKAASDLQESMSKVNVVFETNAKEIVDWSKTSATAMGISQQKALETAGTFGNLFVALKIGRTESTAMSKSLVQLGSDLGSFNNVSADEALLALRAGLVGETEPLRRFGVNLNQATLEAEAMRMGLTKAGEELTAAAKAQAAYSLILEQTKTAQGDFARTSGGVAAKTKQAAAELENLKATIGEDLIPVQLELLKVGRDLLKFFTDLPDPVKRAAIAIGLTAGIMAPGIAAFAQLVGLIRDLKGAGAAGAGVKGLAKTVAAEAGATAAGQALGGAVAPTVAAGAARTGLLSRLGAGARTLAGRAFLPAAIATTAATVAHVGGNYADARFGKAPVSFGDTLDALNPFSNRQAREDAANRARMEEFRKARASGQSPAQQAQRAAAEAAAAKIPTPPSKETLDKEAKALTDKLANVYDARVAQAKALVEGTPESKRAEAEAKAMLPLIGGRITEIQKLQAEEKRRNGDTETYYQLERERWQLEGEAKSIQSDLAKAAEERQKEAIEQQKELRESQNRLAMQIAEFRISGVREEQRAQAELMAKQPVLQNLQRQISDEARSLVPKMRGNADLQKRYLELGEEWYRHAATIEELKLSASQEQANNLKKLQDDQKKAAEEAKRAKEEGERLVRQQAEEKQDVASARVGLLEARLRNIPGLSDQQRQQLLIPELQKERQSMLTALPGETESEKLRRLTGAAGIENRILSAMGILGDGAKGRQFDPFGGNGPQRLIGGGFAPGVDPRQQALAIAQSAGRGRMPSPTVIIVESRGDLLRQLDALERGITP
jgi:hypothetical protein